ILGVGTNNYLYTRSSLSLTSPWVEVANSGLVKSICVLPSGAILGVGTDNNLWLRPTLQSPWQQLTKDGTVSAATPLPDNFVAHASDTDATYIIRAGQRWQVPNQGTSNALGLFVSLNGAESSLSQFPLAGEVPDLTQPPTADQQTLAKQNLSNLIDFFDLNKQNCNDRLQEAYDKVDEDPTVDAGESFMNNIFDSMLWGIGGISFPGSAFVSAFIANLFWGYATNPPASLQGQLGSMLDRLNDNFDQARTDLAQYHDNVVDYWNQPLVNSQSPAPTTPGQLKNILVSGLGSGFISIPDKDSVPFSVMLAVGERQLRLSAAQQLLGKKWVSAYPDSNPQTPTSMSVQQFDSQGPSLISSNPSYFITDIETTTTKQCGKTYYGVQYNQYWLASDPNVFKEGAAPLDLCQWLFKDDGFGNLINPEAIAGRWDVFTNWGLQAKEINYPYHNYGGGPVGLAAAPMGAPRPAPSAPIGDILLSKGRAYMARQVVERAKSDPAFLSELLSDPNGSVESLFGAAIPEGVQVRPVVEPAGDFFLVIPWLPDGQNGQSEVTPPKDWQELVAGANRLDFERQLVAKAQADPAFMLTLTLNPRRTLESFLGFGVPDDARVAAFCDGPDRYFVVLPQGLAPA
ncbi:MAG TPA: hypothetical protein VFX96_11020, partial [Pyrinomonadaceae bacterium]|nr:hypothetical protein [Pyrinomonadaceae bacterium]